MRATTGRGSLPDPRAGSDRQCAPRVRLAEDAYCNDVDLAQIKAELRLVNKTLWEIEDRIRAKEAAKRFDQEFIELARYFQNDKRSGLKGQINRLKNSEIVEEKQYTRYKSEDTLIDSQSR
jgi:hypothetical protein